MYLFTKSVVIIVTNPSEVSTKCALLLGTFSGIGFCINVVIMDYFCKVIWKES
jgi:hypothetical protein